MFKECLLKYFGKLQCETDLLSDIFGLSPEKQFVKRWIGVEFLGGG